MQSTIDKAEGSARGADRMGDQDVISISLAKDLIEEAYKSGIESVSIFLQNRNDSCNCADAVTSLLTGVNHYKP